ncbi:MAG: NAD(+)/NADH kinase [Elusimicrobia bacterium]|nr:NAD(+)/NADH kinase [Elusimicrobiota bacterium]
MKNNPGSFSPIALFHNPHKSAARRALPDIKAWLARRGVKVVGRTGLRAAKAVLALGGDGTLLAAARLAAPWGVPLLGVNVGRLGFLTATDVERVYPLLERLFEGRLPAIGRMMLSADGHASAGRPRLALNDVVIHAQAPGRAVRLAVHVNGALLGNYVGDGLIVATPTGSTAYSMAAGGPLVSPEMDLLVLTPVCAHSLNQRPIILPPESVVEVRLDPRHRAERLVISLDGQEHWTAGSEHPLVLRKARERVRIYSEGDQPFFSLLREKLSWGER